MTFIVLGWILIVFFLTLGFVLSITNDDVNFVGVGAMLAFLTAIFIFGIYGNSKVAKGKVEVEKVLVTKHEDFWLLSAPDGTTYRASTISDLRRIEAGAKLYKIYSTNRYGTAYFYDFVLE
jgi:hypothetical protein